MQVLTKAELFARKEFYAREFKNCIFIYPTDTIYGVGCDATNGVLVDKVRELKQRFDMPFSIIAPSIEWIREQCIITEQAEEWLAKLPGPYTLILRMKNPEEFPLSVTKGLDTIGVRIPDHWISEAVTKFGRPIITTSANRHGENHMRKVEDLSAEWREKISYVIYEEEIIGTPSTLIHLDKEEILVQER